jgi:hypothetical protein
MSNTFDFRQAMIKLTNYSYRGEIPLFALLRQLGSGKVVYILNHLMFLCYFCVSIL